MNESFWPKCELWHRERLKELSYYWNEDTEYQLPDLCPICQEILSVNEINSGTVTISSIDVICPECSNKVTFGKRFVKGSSLNEGYIFHEDGFNAFLGKTRSVAAVSLTHACCDELNRAETHFVYSFIPTTFLPDKVVHKFDAFLEPLIWDVANLYINGITITIREDINIGDSVISAGDHIVHCLLLLGTAD